MSVEVPAGLNWDFTAKRDVLSLPCAYPSDIEGSKVGTRVESTTIMSVDGHIQDVWIVEEGSLSTVTMMNIPMRWRVLLSSCQDHS